MKGHQGEGSILSMIDVESPLDAVLLFRRTGVLVEGWTKSAASQDIVTVMAATMLGSVQTLVEALGDATPSSVIVETEERRILAAKVGTQEALLLVAPKSVGDGFLRQTARRLQRRLRPRAPSEPTPRTPVEIRK